MIRLKKSSIATELKIEIFKPLPNRYKKKSAKTQKFWLVLFCPLCRTVCFFTPVLDIVNCYFIVASFYPFFTLSLSLSLSLSLTLPPSPPTSQSSLRQHHGGGFHSGLWVLLKDFGFFILRFFVGCLDLDFFLLA